MLLAVVGSRGDGLHDPPIHWVGLAFTLGRRPPRSFELFPAHAVQAFILTGDREATFKNFPTLTTLALSGFLPAANTFAP